MYNTTGYASGFFQRYKARFILKALGLLDVKTSENAHFLSLLEQSSMFRKKALSLLQKCTWK